MDRQQQASYLHLTACTYCILIILTSSSPNHHNPHLIILTSSSPHPHLILTFAYGSGGMDEEGVSALDALDEAANSAVCLRKLLCVCQLARKKSA